MGSRALGVIDQEGYSALWRRCADLEQKLLRRTITSASRALLERVRALRHLFSGWDGRPPEVTDRGKVYVELLSVHREIEEYVHDRDRRIKSVNADQRNPRSS